MSEKKEPKFKVGQRVRCGVPGFEGKVEAVDVQRMASVFAEVARRDANLAHAAISQVIDGFNKLRADIEDGTDDEPGEPAVEVMSIMEGLRESLNSIRAKAMNFPAFGVMVSVDETFDQLDDLSEVIDELIEQRDAARANGPEFEFTEDGRTIAPLFVPPGSVATWLFGMGVIETRCGHLDGRKCFEFSVAEKPAKPGDVFAGERSREPRIRIAFTDDAAIHRLIADLQNLAAVKLRGRVNDG